MSLIQGLAPDDDTSNTALNTDKDDIDKIDANKDTTDSKTDEAITAVQVTKPKKKYKKRNVASLLEEPFGCSFEEGGVRKSGRLVDRPRFSDIENLKSLIYFDTSFWVGDNKTKKRKVSLYLLVYMFSLIVQLCS